MNHKLVFDDNAVMRWFTGRMISRSFTDKWVSPTSSDDTSTSSQTIKVECPNPTRQTTSWMLSTDLFKCITKDCMLIFDEKGVMRWSTDGRVSQSSTDKLVSPTSDDDTPTSSPTTKVAWPSTSEKILDAQYEIV